MKKQMKLSVIAILLCLAGLNNALSANTTPSTALLSQALGIEISNDLVRTPVAGLYETVVEEQIVYLSQDGRYALQGFLIDLQTGQNLTEQRLAGSRIALINKVPLEEMIIFKPQKTQHVVFIFTDIDCGYCRKLHAEMQSYLDQGIEIRYLAYPRTGPNTPSAEKYERVWCATDRNAALTKAKSGVTVESAACASPIKQQYELGNKIGIGGTPAIIMEDGTLLPGYLPASELSKLLNEKRNK